MNYSIAKQQLEKAYQTNIEKVTKDIQDNPIYKQIPQHHIQQITEIIDVLKKNIERSFNQTDVFDSTIQKLLDEIQDTASDGGITNNKNLLMVEHTELLGKYEKVFNTTQLQIDQLKSPIFGIIQIEIDGKETTHYISKNGVVDTNIHVLASDWRSEVGQLFYNIKVQNGVGHVKIKGETKKAILEQKHTLTYRDGVLVSYSDILDDKYNIHESLAKDLAVRKGGKFKDIIATIQEDQDKIIRLDANQAISLQGCAGSGKTSIAVHRLSHIFFNREKYSIDPERTVYITPNQLFSDYLEDVQTSLGLEGTRFITYLGWAIDLLFKNTTPINSNIKLHPKFLSSDNPYNYSVKDMTSEVFPYVKKLLKKFNLKLVDQLKDDFEDTYHIDIVLRHLEQEFTVLDIVNLQKEAIEQTSGIEKEFLIEIVDIYQKLEFYTLFGYVVNKLGYQTEFKAEYIYNDLDETNESNDLTVQFTNEDIPALLKFRQEIYLKGDAMSQMLIIDEAQNYNTEQVSSMLDFTYPNRFAVVGDIHQQVNPEGIQNLSLDSQPMANYVDKDKTYSAVIGRCYRTTRKIMEMSYKPFGDKLRQDLAANFFYREGEDVEIYKNQDVDILLQETAQQADKDQLHTIAVISNLDSLQKIRESFSSKQLSNYELLPIGENNYQKGIFFLQPEDITGLEFDVVLYIGDLKKVEEYTDWASASNMHVIMSRALHKLILCDSQ